MKKRQFCVHFVSPIKTKSVPEGTLFVLLQEYCHKRFSYKRFATSVFRTRILPQVFFVQVVCYKCFCRQKFCYKCGYTSVLHKEFCKVPSKPKTVFATSVFSHTASFICCKAHVSSFNAMQQYQPKSRQRFSLCKGVSGLAESAKHLCNASVTMLLNFVFLYGCITTLYVYCDALSLTKQFALAVL